MALKAKCPECGKKAEVDDDLSHIKCEYCGFCIPYEQYIEIMKERAVAMTDNFQTSWDRRPL
jgi:DNA-directed RNA polymerase subunit RPC12/RpoP